MKVVEYIKKCSKCDKYKVLNEFYLRKDNGKYRSSCQECNNLYFKQRYTENKEQINIKRSIKNAENPESNRSRVKIWKAKNPEKVRENSRKSYEHNKTPEKLMKNAQKAADWRLKNKDKIKEIKKKQRNRIEVKLADNLRGRLRKALLNNQKAGSAVRDLGCSIDELKVHLESQFYINQHTGEQMTWNNYSFYGWHIDHIIPLSRFNLTDKEQFLKACHYTNLQPLWAEENLRKSDKITK